jgi:hypothetical protein
MAEAGKQSLADFLVAAPLYVGVEVQVPLSMTDNAILIPEVITRYCARCSAELQWDHDEPRGSADIARDNQVNGVIYACRNCRVRFNVWFFWRRVTGRVAETKVLATKVGQYPPLDIPLPKELQRALGDSADLWKKGLRSRHQGYGIGALAYFRRVVEDSTARLLGLLAAAMRAAGEPPSDIEAVEALIAAKAPFDTKMEQAAKMIPRSLRPGGANPFQTMFEVLSGRLHGATDADCCALVDALAKSMLLVVAKLNEHIDTQRAYDEAVKDLERLRPKPSGT